MNKLNVLKLGLEHIAANHNLAAFTSDGELCIFGGSSVPMVSDVRMLCEDLGIGHDCIYPCEYGVDVEPSERWLERDAEKEYVETGFEMWKRKDFKLEIL